jgi:hypothetical protein
MTALLGPREFDGIWKKLKKKYPKAAAELEKEFAAAVRKATLKIRREAAKPAVAKDLGEVHVIRVRGKGKDGKEYVAKFDAVFPPGTKILQAEESRI